jgi:Flp pilus assembly protein TadG
MSLSRFRRERRSAVALLYALMAVPILGLVGLAVDFGMWNQAYASMELAASGAALNAVKIAAAATNANDPAAVEEGQTAGKQWFMAQLGAASNAPHLNVGPPSVTISTGVTTTAKVRYTGYVPSIFGNWFAVAQYPIALEATAVVTTSPFLNVEILLDNSPSMEIGATPGDIAAMMYLTPCSAPGAVYGVAPLQTSGGSSPSGQIYSAYSCQSGNKYDGDVNYGEESCPITSGIAGPTNGKSAPYNPLTTSNYVGGPSCTNLAKQTAKGVSGQYPLAGAPCAFACHFDTTDPLSAQGDYYALARNTIGKTACYNAGSNPAACGITLRFDLVKTAVNQVISTMQTDNLSAINNLNVGIFTFDVAVHQIYPSPTTCGTPGSLACQAGNSWSTATTLVGAPPTTPNTPDTGIQPYTGSNGADTNLPNVLTSFASTYLTAAGDGSSPASPLKVLFLVTDGMADYGAGSVSSPRVNVAIDPSQCETYKNMGYTVYVLYTPYYPLMNGFYLSTNYSIAEGTGSGSLAYNLQQCSSDPVNDYIQANPADANSIATALQKFLQRALTSPARFTQ